MPSKVYNNVEGHRLFDNSRVCEDVTSVTLPTISHPTTTISASGMAMDIDVPNTSRLEAMEFSVSHNNGVNCELLGTPGKHNIELRLVRQRYNVAKGDLEHESVKYRIGGMFKSCEKGNVETGNPLGSTNKYSVVRYEEIVNGVTTVLIDATGPIKINGVDYTDQVENLLK